MESLPGETFSGDDEVQDMTKRAGGRFIRQWNKKNLIPRLTKCIAMHGDYVEK
jgi:hypothetical protein